MVPKHKLSLILMIVLMAITIGGCASDDKKYVEQTNVKQNQNKCIECHEMKPEFLTWQTSAHSKFECTTCHKVNFEDYQEQHQNQSFEKPITMKDTIPDSICLQCHSNNRVTSPSGDLIIPHKRHAKAKVACVACHSGVVHGNISKRGITASGELSNFDTWNKNVAKKVATDYFRQPNMWTCIKCHKQTGITRKCGACHITIPELPSHDKPTWMAEHGKVARQKISECTKCHSTPGQRTKVNKSAKDKAKEFARSQDFCTKCHLQRPKMHQESMLKIHPKKVVEKGVQNCLTCHDRQQPKRISRVTRTYCNQCHWNS